MARARIIFRAKLRKNGNSRSAPWPPQLAPCIIGRPTPSRKMAGQNRKKIATWHDGSWRFVTKPRYRSLVPCDPRRPSGLSWALWLAFSAVFGVVGRRGPRRGQRLRRRSRRCAHERGSAQAPGPHLCAFWGARSRVSTITKVLCSILRVYYQNHGTRPSEAKGVRYANRK